jgi:hypothetical protein
MKRIVLHNLFLVVAHFEQHLRYASILNEVILDTHHPLFQVRHHAFEKLHLPCQCCQSLFPSLYFRCACPCFYPVRQSLVGYQSCV